MKKKMLQSRRVLEQVGKDSLIFYAPLMQNSNDIIGGISGNDTDMTYGSANGAYFNGNTSHIEYGNILDLQEFSLYFECYILSNVQYRPMFGTNTGSTDITGLALLYLSATQLSLYYRLTTGSVRRDIQSSFVPLNTWISVLISGIGGNKIDMWINGLNRVSNSINANFVHNQPFKIGESTPQSVSPGSLRYFSGYQRHYKIYNRYLMPHQI